MLAICNAPNALIPNALALYFQSMFDDLTKEPEDIFSQSDKVEPQKAAEVTEATKAAQVSEVTEVTQVNTKKSFPWKPIVLVVGILVVIAAAFYLSVRILSSRTPVTPKPPVTQTTEAPSDLSVPSDQIVPVQEEPVVSTADADKDGLTDEEESEIGTSPRNPDTDADGLFDLEEVRTWQTNPLQPDTDADGYLDGAEVSAGYNPNGSGVLREPPTQSD